MAPRAGDTQMLSSDMVYSDNLTILAVGGQGQWPRKEKHNKSPFLLWRRWFFWSESPPHHCCSQVKTTFRKRRKQRHMEYFGAKKPKACARRKQRHSCLFFSSKSKATSSLFGGGSLEMLLLLPPDTLLPPPPPPFFLRIFSLITAHFAIQLEGGGRGRGRGSKQTLIPNSIPPPPSSGSAPRGKRKWSTLRIFPLFSIGKEISVSFFFCE